MYESFGKLVTSLFIAAIILAILKSFFGIVFGFWGTFLIVFIILLLPSE